MDKTSGQQEQAKIILITALFKALETHDKLGNAGLELVRKNEFGDSALLGDIEMEKSVLSVLQESKLPIRVISEEHGTVDITDAPILLGVLDGIDGTDVYKKGPGIGRYGTMFGILDTLDPTYKDYVACGVMEHSTGRLFLATNSGGAFVIKGTEKIAINASGKMKFNHETRIYADNFGICKTYFQDKLQNFKPADREFSAISSAVHYVDVACGEADLTLECTRKGNLEIATAYGLIREAGGVMVDSEGEDIGNCKYLEFGQKSQLPIITAATMTLVQELISYLESTTLPQ